MGLPWVLDTSILKYFSTGMTPLPLLQHIIIIFSGQDSEIERLLINESMSRDRLVEVTVH